MPGVAVAAPQHQKLQNFSRFSQSGAVFHQLATLVWMFVATYSDWCWRELIVSIDVCIVRTFFEQAFHLLHVSRKISKIGVIAKIKNFMVFRVEVCKQFSGKGVTWKPLFRAFWLCHFARAQFRRGLGKSWEKQSWGICMKFEKADLCPAIYLFPSSVPLLDCCLPFCAWFSELLLA